jgi:mRNA-degrading endonuclease RelE of RelBE toxin-antitoxin system
VKIARTERFMRAYGRLNAENRAQARKAISQLAEDLRHPGLRVKRIRGTRGIWEARVSRGCRLTFQVEGDTILLRNIGEHDDVLGRP